MNQDQAQIQQKAREIAENLEATVRTVPDERNRARALRDVLNLIKPGLSEQVTAAATVLQRQGVTPLSAALHQALVRRLELYLGWLVGQEEQGLGELGTVNVAELLTSIGELAEVAATATTSIYTAATRSDRDRIAASRDVNVANATATSDRARAEIARLNNQAEERRLRDAESQRAHDAEMAARRDSRSGGGAPGGGGWIWWVLGGVVLVGGGVGTYFLIKRSSSKKVEE